MTAYDDGRVSVHLGDCLDVLRTLPDASVDAVVTDPPYALGFMGKEWDSPTRMLGQSGSIRPGRDEKGVTKRGYDHAAPPAVFQQWCELWAAECLRVLKPGGHMLAFGGTRTWHRLACAVEDAGFEVRDSIAWLYGSGFPKSLDVSKAIDKRRDWSLVERLSGEIRRARTESGLSLAEVGQATLDATGGTYGKWYHRGGHMFFETGRSLPSRPEWEHLRRVLPIAPEFIEVYDEAEREVIGERNGSIGRGNWRAMEGRTDQMPERFDITAPATPDAERWQGWGTALKPAFEPVVVARKPLAGTVAANVLEHGTGALNIDATRVAGDVPQVIQGGHKINGGRYNDSEGAEVRRTLSQPHVSGRWPANVVLDESQAAALDEQSGERPSGKMMPTHTDAKREVFGQNASGGYTTMETYGDSGGASRFFPTFRYEAKAPATERPRVNGTAHPTVKPLDLMRWLVRLVTPPGGTVLEPFAGSGTTVEACIVEGFRCVAIERGEEYLPLILQRIHRRRDPVAAIRQTGDDLGLFELDGESA